MAIQVTTEILLLHMPYFHSDLFSPVYTYESAFPFLGCVKPALCCIKIPFLYLGFPSPISSTCTLQSQLLFSFP